MQNDSTKIVPLIGVIAFKLRCTGVNVRPEGKLINYLQG